VVLTIDIRTNPRQNQSECSSLLRCLDCCMCEYEGSM